METAIEIKNVSVSFDGNSVLDGITMSVMEREFLGIIGPNGGGKTTLLKVILGLVKPDSGTVRIFGKPPEEARRLIGYVPQRIDADIMFPITAREVVLMGLVARRGLFRRYTAEDHAAVDAAMKKVSLDAIADRQFGALSGGERQRTLIARAIAGAPKILLLDEPSASLDTNVGRGVYQLLDELSGEITIVLVTHDIGVISKHVRSIACLAKILHLHSEKEHLDPEAVKHAYGCPIDLIAHGAAHRVLDVHGETGEGGGDD